MLKHLNMIVSLTNQSPCELQKTAETSLSELLSRVRSEKKEASCLLNLTQDQHTGIGLSHSVSNYLFLLDD